MPTQKLKEEGIQILHIKIGRTTKYKYNNLSGLTRPNRNRLSKDIFGILTYPINMPSSNGPVMQSIEHVENVATAERHFTLIGFRVVEMGFDVERVTSWKFIQYSVYGL